MSVHSMAKLVLIFLIGHFHVLAAFHRHHQQRSSWDWARNSDRDVENGPEELEQSIYGRQPRVHQQQQHFRHPDYGHNQQQHQRGFPPAPSRGKMNAAGFFYISADFPLNQEEQHEDVEQEQPMLEDLANEDCSMFPNGTYKAPYAFTCSDPQLGPPLFVVHDTALANRSGHYEYPLDLSDPAPMLRVFMDLTSFATRNYESMRAEVALLRRKVGWLGCGWMPIPTFGAFDAMDICEANDSCPIFPGRQVLELKLEPSSVFLAMLRLMLHDGKPPYELRIRLINNRSHGEELLCVAFQTRLLF